MITIKNINDVPDSQVAGEALSYRVALLPVSYLDLSKKWPKKNLNREVASLPLLPGKQPAIFAAHSIPGYAFEGSRGEHAMTGKHTFELVLGGYRDEVLNFIEEFAGSKFILFFTECGDDVVNMLGSACKPIVLSDVKGLNNKEGRYFTFTFTSSSMMMPVKYTGSQFSFGGAAAGTGTVAGTATTLAITAEHDTYVVQDGTSSAATIAAVSGLTSSDEGRLITLLGDGASNASLVKANSVFILKGGTQWAAKKGASLTLSVLSANQLVEVSRVDS